MGKKKKADKSNSSRKGKSVVSATKPSRQPAVKKGGPDKDASLKAKSKSLRRSKPRVTYAKAKRALDKYRDELMRLGSRVTGVSIGPRLQGDEVMDELVIRLQVANVRDKQWLKRNAEKIGYRKDYEGVDTDIVVWQFHTSAKSTPLKDGECINGLGGNGTLGTTVIIDDANGKPIHVWLTAAHVASRDITPPPGSLPMSICGGNSIGSVEDGNYIRNTEVDVAFVVPEPPLPAPLPSLRSVASLTPSDLNATVTMIGAKNPASIGRIISIDFDGEVSSPGGNETVVNHIQVRADSGKFAEHGDSGAIVKKGRKLLGMTRAASKEGVAVVTLMDVIRAKKGFNL